MVSRLPVPYLKIAVRPWLTEPGSVSDPPAQATVVNAKTIAVNAANLILVFMVASSDLRALCSTALTRFLHPRVSRTPCEPPARIGLQALIGRGSMILGRVTSRVVARPPSNRAPLPTGTTSAPERRPGQILRRCPAQIPGSQPSRA